MVSRLFEAARDVASDFLAAVGTCLYFLPGQPWFRPPPAGVAPIAAARGSLR